MPAGYGASQGQSSGGLQLPAALQSGFATAMSQTLVLPAVVILAGTLVAAFFVRPLHLRDAERDEREPATTA